MAVFIRVRQWFDFSSGFVFFAFFRGQFAFPLRLRVFVIYPPPPPQNSRKYPETAGNKRKTNHLRRTARRASGATGARSIAPPEPPHTTPGRPPL